MTLTTQPFIESLDLPAYVGQRSSTFRFELHDGVTGAKKADLAPIRDSPPTLTHDTTRTIKRQLSSLSLGVDDTQLVNALRDQVWVYMSIGAIDYPLGRYVFSDSTSLQLTSGMLTNATLLDQMYIIDQQLEQSFTAQTYKFAPDGVAGAATTLQTVLAPFNLSLQIESSPYGTNGSWSIGTNRGSVIEDIALDGDYFSPWFDHNNNMRFIRSFNPADREPAFDWDANSVVIQGTVTKSSDLLGAVNRFIVVSNASDATEAIVGRYDVPDSAPWSQKNRGFVIPSVITRSINPRQANTVAANIGQRQQIYERYELSTLPDPRYDSYDVIRWQGANWLELGWSLPLIEGATMSHTIRKAYS